MGSDTKKELILINPGVNNYIVRFCLLLVLGRNIPFSLLILSALTPSGYKIRIFNQKVLWFKRDFAKGVLVGITCVTSSAANAYSLAMRYRNSGAYVVMGGPHVSALPEEALQYCNSVVIGEAETIWKEVIRDYENNCLKKIYRGEPLEDFFSPTYDYFLNLNPRILKLTRFNLSRGCKYHCDFCARPSNWPRYVKIEQATAIIKRMIRSNWPAFVKRLFPPFTSFSEDNIFSNPEYAKRLFKALIPLKMNWSSQCSIDIAFDDEALRLAKESGCKNLFIGFETIYPKEIQKTAIHNISSVKDFASAIRKIRSYGIGVTGGFIIGFDYYTHFDYFKLLFFFITSFVRCRFFWIALTLLTPYPGTELFINLEKEGRIRTYDWRKYDLFTHVTFKPKKLSVFSLILWFITIRFITFYCTTLGLMIFLGYGVFFYFGRFLRILQLTLFG